MSYPFVLQLLKCLKCLTVAFLHLLDFELGEHVCLVNNKKEKVVVVVEVKKESDTEE